MNYKPVAQISEEAISVLKIMRSAASKLKDKMKYCLMSFHF